MLTGVDTNQCREKLPIFHSPLALAWGSDYLSELPYPELKLGE
jgi:hypothetical protein